LLQQIEGWACSSDGGSKKELYNFGMQPLGIPKIIRKDNTYILLIGCYLFSVMTDWWSGMDFEGSCRSLFEILFRNFPEGTNEHTKKTPFSPSYFRAPLEYKPRPACLVILFLENSNSGRWSPTGPTWHVGNQLAYCIRPGWL
jgi:hypothetical protein